MLTGKNRDIPSGALQNTDAATKGVRFDLCLSRVIDLRWNNALSLRVFHIDNIEIYFPFSRTYSWCISVL